MVNKQNDNLIFRGEPLATQGSCIKDGQKAPDFKLVGNDLADLTLASFSGKCLVLSVVPSVDTPTCNLQTIRFNDEAKKLGDKVVMLTVSMDLPFAQKRWHENAKCASVLSASDYKYRTFGPAYGVFLPGLGLLARAVFVVDANRQVKYVDYVKDLSTEPEYEPVLKAVAECLG